MNSSESEASDSEEGDEDEYAEQGSEELVHDPLGRRGACSFVHDEQFYLLQGYAGGSVLDQRPRKSLEVLNMSTGQWSSVTTSGEALPESISGACCTVINGRLYTFGGWIAGLRNADVHELDLVSLVWKKLEAGNPGEGPFLKDKAGMVSYGEAMLCVFGGYGYPSWNHFNQGSYKRQKGASYDWDANSFHEICWTNELHLFHVKECYWISPETTGSRPPPCAAFTFTRVDPCRVVLFGGRQRECRVNEVHILNMENWHWSGAITAASPSEPWPAQRSFHTACSVVDPLCVNGSSNTHLPGSGRLEWLPCAPPDLSPTSEGCCLEPRMFVLWGMNNDADPISDAWVFDIKTLTWKEVSLPPWCGGGRVWHTASAFHPTVGEAEIVAFGGSMENLFKNSEVHIMNVQGTTVLRFGVSPLFRLCLEHVATHTSLYAPLVHCLPMHIQQLLAHQCKRLDNLSHFKIARL